MNRRLSQLLEGAIDSLGNLRWALAIAVGCVACGGEGVWESPVSFGDGVVSIIIGSDSILIPVEVAETDQQRSFGLMQRSVLEADRGMIFLYPTVQDTTRGFWMFQTRIPLDIAFVDSAGVIVSIREMDPCESTDPQWCPIYLPGARYIQALEVNRGFFTTLGIGVGDAIRISRDGQR